MQTTKRKSYIGRVKEETKARDLAVQNEQSAIIDLAQLLGIEVEPTIAKNVARWRVRNGAKFHHYSEEEGRSIAVKNGAKRSFEFAKHCFWTGGLLIYIERSKK